MDYTKEFHIDETNSETGPIVRWNSNNRVPFNDMLENFMKAGLIDQQIVDNSNAARKAEQIDSIKAYCDYRKKYGYSNEEKMEMRAVFGKDKVVDALTDKTVQL